MATYQSDLRDIYFNLFDVLDITQFKSYGLDVEDYKSIVSEFDKFVANEVFPTRQLSDEQGVKLENEKVYAPECLRNVQKGFYENGWFALGFPEDIGGTPVPETIFTVNNSLANGSNCAWMMYPGLSRAAANVIRLVGTQEQKDTYLPPMFEGTWGGTMCLTEAGAGSDVGNLRTTATPNADGSYQISGVKIFISSGESDYYENNIHLVLARTPNAPESTKGISLFIVPRFKINADGTSGESNDVICTKIEEKMGIHASATCELTFGTNNNCIGYLIGKEFDGMANMFIMMNEARLLCGVQGESQANLAYLMALAYSKERSQFGTELINHPDIKRMLIRMRTLTRGMKSLCLYTANIFEMAKTNHDFEKLGSLLTPLCKSYCSDQGFNVAIDAVQVHGGYGFCTEYGMEQFLRDIKIASIYEGTNGIQAIDLLMRKILKDKGEALMMLNGEVQKTLAAVTANTELSKNLESELKLFTKVLGSTQNLMGFFTQKATSKKYNDLLEVATDFQLFLSQLVVAWRHLESASIASNKISAAANAEEKEYLESKVTDFKAYCKYFLITNISIEKSIIDFEQNISSLGF